MTQIKYRLRISHIGFTSLGFIKVNFYGWQRICSRQIYKKGVIFSQGIWILVVSAQNICYGVN